MRKPKISKLGRVSEDMAHYLVLNSLQYSRVAQDIRLVSNIQYNYVNFNVLIYCKIKFIEKNLPVFLLE